MIYSSLLLFLFGIIYAIAGKGAEFSSLDIFILAALVFIGDRLDAIAKYMREKDKLTATFLTTIAKGDTDNATKSSM